MDRLQEWNRWQKGAALVAALGVCWCLNKAAAVLSRPSPERIVEGRELFVHEWVPNDPLSAEGDGLGPVFNATSCVACHFQGGVGGGGPNERNVTAFTAFERPVPDEVNILSGVVHADAISSTFKETVDELQVKFPIVPGQMRGDPHCGYREPDFNPLLVESINTPPIFGSGLIETISERDIRGSLRWKALSSMGRELQGDFDNLPTGRVRMLPDGRVGKFGWKAQFATLEEFVATACAVEVGLTNPLRAQDIPKLNMPNLEAGLDLDRSQFKSLVTFCKTLPAPERVLPEDPAARTRVTHGETLFASIGCAHCHVPDLGPVTGVFSDFLLHTLSSEDDPFYEDEIPIEFVKPGEPARNEWKTPPLWGVADSAPYMHDGSAATLEDAIQRHGGAAASIREAYNQLTVDDRRDLMVFLKSLKAPAPQSLELQLAGAPAAK